MSTGRTKTIIHHLRSLALLRDGAGLTDGQLLSYFIEQRDGAAFAALARRHGPMVWGVCRRVLRNMHDAEDAFQATFLVLARKAASVLPREKVANWLYGVAYTTAHRAKVTTAKRRIRERQVTDMPDAEARQPDHWSDLQPLLDAELSRLPDKYRFPIVLCDLEGKTRKEAARQLGVPDGTVAGRLARARVMLAKRLARQGLAVSGGTLAILLSQNALSARMPTSVVSNMIKAARLFAAGQGAATGVISTKVAALTEGVLKVMLISKIRTGLTVLVVTVVLGLGVAMGVHGTMAAEQSDGSRKNEGQADLLKKDESTTKIGPAPAAPSETKKVIYRLNCSVVKADPNGKDFGADGKGRLVCAPMVLVHEGREASFLDGTDGKMVVSAGDGSRAFEAFRLGISARMKLIDLKDGTLELIATLELTEQEKTAHKHDLRYTGKFLRSVTHLKAGEEIKLVLDKDDSGKPRCWARIKVQPAGFVVTRIQSLPAQEK